jgi:outer membrane protein assembly factor BamA
MSVSVPGELITFNRYWRALCLLLLLEIFCPFPAQAKKKRSRTLKPVKVGTVNVEVQNIFDPNVPGENNWLFRLANTLHIATKPSVIRREMLVYPGDWTDLEKIEESERNLRALPFIKDAKIITEPAPNGTVNLLVRTQDSWTTQPQINFASAGGQTTSSVGFEEVNFLGYGKDLSYFYKKNVDGISQNMGYKDPQFLNTRFRLLSDFQDTPTGNAQDLDIERPFYSLTTRAAAGLPVSHSEGLVKVFQNGSQISQYDENQLSLSPFAGLRLNNDPLNVLRSQLSYRYQENIFKPQDVTLPGTLPANKALSGPIASASFTQSDFIKETFADRTGRVEDINLGHVSNLGVGYIGRALGATENSIPFSANDAFGFGGNGSWFGLFSYGTSARYALLTQGQSGGRLFNAIYFANFNYYQHLLEDFPMTGVFHAESAYLQNPDAANVLSLGGDTGMRGFKVNSFTGNKSILFNLENRFYYPKEVLHLAYVGGAVFVDAGQVQPQGIGFTAKDIHVDIGAGMRFGLTRSADGTVFRIDLAYAVGPVQQSSRWILSVSSAQGFTREANTYKNFASPTQTQ